MYFFPLLETKLATSSAEKDTMARKFNLRPGHMSNKYLFQTVFSIKHFFLTFLHISFYKQLII